LIGLHYQNKDELAGALVSLARRCQELGAHLCFLGSEAICEDTRTAVHDLDATGLLAFRPLPAAQHQHGWQGRTEVIRTALLEASIAGGSMVAWVESPAPMNGPPLGPVLRDSWHSLDSAPVSSTVICAYCLDTVSEEGRTNLLECCDIVINAKLLLPRCPSWLIDRVIASNHNHTPVIVVPAYTVDSDLRLTTFVQAEKLAALGQLATGVAHELGNPLSIISSSLQYLHQRLAEANDPASEFTMTALTNVERMHGLLRSMLDFAAVKKPEYEQVDLKEIISEVLRFTAAECARREITVEVAFDPALPRIWVDPPGIKQIVLNLVKNSLDALDQSGNTLAVRTRMLKGGAQAVEIANNGPAITADVLSHLFRPFHTTKHGGTGLGLYLSRLIAKEHGGDLEAKNLPQGGVRFTLTLPAGRGKGGDHGPHPDRRR
jgi:nitrogen-specific signal transduction histidine kinase